MNVHSVFSREMGRGGVVQHREQAIDSEGKNRWRDKRRASLWGACGCEIKVFSSGSREGRLARFSLYPVFSMRRRLASAMGGRR
jgi:hypothetical protein